MVVEEHKRPAETTDRDAVVRLTSAVAIPQQLEAVVVEEPMVPSKGLDAVLPGLPEFKDQTRERFPLAQIRAVGEIGCNDTVDASCYPIDDDDDNVSGLSHDPRTLTQPAETQPTTQFRGKLVGGMLVASVALVVGLVVLLSNNGNSQETDVLLENETVAFQSTPELYRAVDLYQIDINLTRQYGTTIQDWDVSQIQDFSRLFLSKRNAPFTGKLGRLISTDSLFNEDLARWNTSSATNMAAMFAGTGRFNGDISSWDVSRVVNTSFMFYRAVSFNRDLSSWDTGSVEDMRSMFQDAHAFNQSVSQWNVSAMTHISGLFSNADVFNGDLSQWDLRRVSTTKHMFLYTQSFNQDLSAWNVSAVQDMTAMFSGAKAFNGDVSMWDVSAVSDMVWLFRDTDAFNQNLSKWNVGSVKRMTQMFQNALAFNGNISTWDLSSIEEISWAFQGAASFDQDLCGWLTTNNWTSNQFTSVFEGTACPETSDPIIPYGPMCHSCVEKTTQPPRVPCTGEIPLRTFENTEELYQAVDSYLLDPTLTTEYGSCIGDWDVSRVRSFDRLFDANRNRTFSFLNHVSNPFDEDISRWNTSNAISMFGMFYYANKFNRDISKWDVSKVEQMSNTFNLATAFNQDLSAWSVGNVKDMREMFFAASSFNQDLSSWDVSKVSSAYWMFFNAGSFNQNLCPWRRRLPLNATLDRMFDFSRCGVRADTVLPVGPLCYLCE